MPGSVSLAGKLVAFNVESKIYINNTNLYFDLKNCVSTNQYLFLLRLTEPIYYIVE